MVTSKLLQTLLVGVSAGALALACGGATDTSGLFSSPGGGAGAFDAGHGGSGGSSGGGSGSSSGGGGGSGGSSGGGSGSSSGGGSGSSSGGGSGSGSSSGGGSGSGSSSGSSSGGGADAGTDPGILCGKAVLGGGSKYCVAGKELCCASDNGGSTAATYRCETSTSTACESSGGTPISCDNAAECPGQVCCGSLDTSSDTYVSIQCQATCDVQQNEYTFCDPNAAVDVCAAIPANGGPAYTCTESGILTGYYRCSNGQ